MPCYEFRAERLPDLVKVLQNCGYRVIAPQVRDAAIVYDEIDSAAELPLGIYDLQNNGSYRLEASDRPTWFAYTVGPSSWKRFLFPPQERLWRSVLSEDGLEFIEEPVDTRATALLGVRACELRALAIQDRIFAEGAFKDERYQARRNSCLIIAVSCARAGATCFCTSTQSGPKALSGFDIELTEVHTTNNHYFLACSGSEQGESILLQMELDPASHLNWELAQEVVQQAAEHMGRKLEIENLPRAIANAHNHSHWDDIARRCLNCANCTMVCPTCFCSTVEDKSDLTGQEAERTRLWDSCFNLSFSYIHGGAIRKSGESRYRQWLTHKLSSWNQQFGELGCTGCGRCITWCPVGIDITEEAAKLREEEVS